ncbi:hypothetical protein R3P38DRAFT_3267400 [Favolaschia claudopus]|uniref:Transcription factor Iwr1 domain-containing protein n=1 Tax=Favolaschia claudopus TaxID=2862362 RepID=A0AAW0BPE0_9AGAR
MSSWLYLASFTDLDCSRTFETVNKNNATLEEPDAFIERKSRIPKTGRVPDILNMEKFYSWDVGEYGPPSREELVGPPSLSDQDLDEEPIGFELDSSLTIQSTNFKSPDCRNKLRNASSSSPSVKSRNTHSPQRVAPSSSADAPLSKQTPSPSSSSLPSRSPLSNKCVGPPFSEDAPLVAATSSASQNRCKSSTDPSVCPSSTTSGGSPHSSSSSSLAASETVISHQTSDFDEFFYNSHADQYFVEVDIPELDPRYVSFISREELFGMPVTANDSLNEYDNDTSEVHMSATENDSRDEYDDASRSEGDDEFDEDTSSTASSPRRIAALPVRRRAVLPTTGSPLAGSSVIPRTDYDWRSDDEDEFSDADDDADGDYVDTLSRPSKRRRTNASKAVPARQPQHLASRRDKGKGRAPPSRIASDYYSSGEEEEENAADDDGSESDYVSASSSSSN